jgi:hypothetical protein
MVSDGLLLNKFIYMHLKKFLPAILFVAILVGSAPVMAANLNEPTTTSVPFKGEDPRAQQLLQRLDEIKGMDKSTLSGTDKKELRKEVKGIRKEMKAIKGGVYLSVGAIIIIILLLVILL